jgi:serine palmitoyltransferase
MASSEYSRLIELYHSLTELISKLPGSAIAWRYFKASHQDDPIRTLLELLLVFFVIRTYSQSRTKGGIEGKSFVKFNDKEIDELVSEWSPEPLLPPCSVTTLPPIIVGPTGPRPRVIFPTAGQDPHDVNNPMSLEGGKIVLNLASSNFAGLAGSERIKEKAVECLRRYGVGSCGPPGFYGTFGKAFSPSPPIDFFWLISPMLQRQMFTWNWSAIWLHS